MNLTLKILAGTAFVLLSTVGVAPVKAQSSATPMESQTQQSEMQQSEMQARQVGTIESISGSTAVVKMKDGTTQEISYSPDEVEDASQVAPGSYVLVNNGKIEGVAYKGTIRNLTGSQAEVELENGDLEPIDVTRAEIGSYNLMEGMPVYIYSDQIVDTASPATSESTPTETESMNNSESYDSQSGYTGRQNSTGTTPDTSTYDSQSQDSTGTYDSQSNPQTQDSTGTRPGTGTYDSQTQNSTGTYESQTNTQTQDSTGTYESQTNTQDSTGTYESQPNTTDSTTGQEAQEPVRGMW
jgi:hypothetical protein